MPKKKDQKKEKITFPIEMDVQYGSKLYHKQLNAGDTVRCIKCGKPFQINNATVRKYGSVLCCICPNVEVHEGEIYFRCLYHADVLYYFDRKVVVK